MRTPRPFLCWDLDRGGAAIATPNSHAVNTMSSEIIAVRAVVVTTTKSVYIRLLLVLFLGPLGLLYSAIKKHCALRRSIGPRAFRTEKVFSLSRNANGPLAVRLDAISGLAASFSQSNQAELGVAYEEGVARWS